MKLRKTIISALCLFTASGSMAQINAPVELNLGISTNLRSWNANTDKVSTGKAHKVTDDYTMLTGKRSHCHNEGTERTTTIVNAQNDTLLIVCRTYKDGVAFRYIIPQPKENEQIINEQTTYLIPSAAKRWMQIYDGPGYEHFFPLCNQGISPEGKQHTKWGIPALFELSAGKFMLITESDVLRNQCGSILTNSDEDRNKYNVELFGSMPLTKGVAWKSPWRVMISGTLADIVGSTLVTDVATPCQMEDVSWINPGISSWIYWAYNHGSQEYSILKEYVDLAKEMKWPYTLVDAEWDVMRGGNIEQLVKYAVSQGIKPMIWYNSTTNWTGEWAPTPQGLLNDPADRQKEFQKISSWGVKGVKIDFFRDDNVETINYYLDLLSAAANNKMLANFHGGTIPRGWQRTYPNFISAESVFGAEWYNNNGKLTNRAAQHNATLPFTRNVIGSMDYTPGTFTDSQHPHITTHAHELALTILFESGIQHMPDRPDTYTTMPTEIKDLLSTLPSTWDDIKLLSGYPGTHAVIARQKADTWYIAGINGLNIARTIQFNLPKELKDKKALVITDGKTQYEFSISQQTLGKNLSIKCAPRGGFVIMCK